jgi:hypothetical protein
MGREIGKLKAEYENLKAVADNKTFLDGINAFTALKAKSRKRRNWRY